MGGPSRAGRLSRSARAAPKRSAAASGYGIRVAATTGAEEASGAGRAVGTLRTATSRSQQSGACSAGAGDSFWSAGQQQRSRTSPPIRHRINTWVGSDTITSRSGASASTLCQDRGRTIIPA